MIAQQTTNNRAVSPADGAVSQVPDSRESGVQPHAPIYIAVDFDGTCVRHEYPGVGPDVPGAVETLRRLVERGDKLILWTIRSGSHLEDAKLWFAERGLPLFGVNENPDQKSWSTSPKVYAPIYIDDAALGAPLLRAVGGGRPYVDWDAVHSYFFGAPPEESV